jgi:hypothetical protein
MSRPGFSLIVVAGLALGGCATSQSLESSSRGVSRSSAFAESVEINNRNEFPVVVKYFTKGGGGPLTLGVVSSARRDTFILPAGGTGYMFAQNESGLRVRGVTFRRFKTESAPVN